MWQMIHTMSQLMEKYLLNGLHQRYTTNSDILLECFVYTKCNINLCHDSAWVTKLIHDLFFMCNKTRFCRHYFIINTLQ